MVSWFALDLVYYLLFSNLFKCLVVRCAAHRLHCFVFIIDLRSDTVVIFWFWYFSSVLFLLFNCVTNGVASAAQTRNQGIARFCVLLIKIFVWIVILENVWIIVSLVLLILFVVWIVGSEEARSEIRKSKISRSPPDGAMVSLDFLEFYRSVIRKFIHSICFLRCPVFVMLVGR